MEDSISDTVRAAITLARQERIKRLQTLRRRLREMFPGHSANIEAALAFWARNATSTRT